MLIQSTRNINRIRLTDSWEQIQGTVNEIKIEKIEKARGDRYYPIINYNFDLGNKNYTGNRLTFESGRVYRSEFNAEYAAKNYIDGNKINIYYNPEEPKENTILKGNIKNEYPLLMFGVLFTLVGVLGNFKFIKKIILKK